MAAELDLGPLKESLDWPSSCSRNHYTNFKDLWVKIYQNLSIIMKEKLWIFFSDHNSIRGAEGAEMYESWSRSALNSGPCSLLPWVFVVFGKMQPTDILWCVSAEVREFSSYGKGRRVSGKEWLLDLNSPFLPFTPSCRGEPCYFHSPT